MVELLYGQETVPQDVSQPIPLTVEMVNVSTQEGFGPGPAESQIIHDLHEEWAQDNGYRDNDNLNAINSERIIKHAKQ